MRNSPAVQTAILGSILLHLRSKRANSRSTLTSVTRLSPSTIGLYVDQLISENWIVESGLEQGTMGRPMRTLSLRSNAGWFAGIEFNAERLRAVQVDFSGVECSSISAHLPPQVDKKTILKEIHRAIVGLTKKAKGTFCAIGIGAPGVVDPASGQAIHYSFVDDWRNVPLRSNLEKKFKVPVTLENNLRTIALAERWFGGGRELDDYVVLGPRRGFGVAIVKEGQLLNGAQHAVGEIGRWLWSVDGKPGEMHDVLSSPAVWRRLKGVSSRSSLPDDLYKALAAFSEDSGTAWQSIVEDYAKVLGILQLVLDSHTYFLHGPQIALGNRFCQAISDRVSRITPALSKTPINIVPSILGDDAGALGAASLAMEAWLPIREE